jgi:hypothetical protein
VAYRRLSETAGNHRCVRLQPTEIVRVNYPLPWAVAVKKLKAVAGRDRKMIFKRLLQIDRDSSVPLRETLRRNGDAGYGHARLLIRYQAG